MIGQTLSHFKITAKLGEGGMGEVYRAEDTKLGREVAIKVLRPTVAENSEFRARFDREAKAISSILVGAKAEKFSQPSSVTTPTSSRRT